MNRLMLNSRRRHCDRSGLRRVGRGAQTLACSLLRTPAPIKHIVYLQYDNVHYQRDRINVPSDLEQMPAMLSFLQNKGTLLVNDHTQVISHTADGIITSITGVYPDRHGQGVSNSYDYFKPTARRLSSRRSSTGPTRCRLRTPARPRTRPMRW